MVQLKFALLQLLILSTLIQVSRCQLPDDIQRELNQNLAEQARIQAMRQKHQQQIKNRSGIAPSPNQPAGNGGKSHDPNNYSYQQVSPPIQYSYYQPYGDAAQPNGGQQVAAQAAPAKGPTAADLDLNNLNFDLPQPQAQVAATPRTQQHLTPSFTGAGGLPVLQPAANAASNANSFVPTGNAPLQPQARVQQGPPLTEADFKDITGGENYGAPGGNDFGLGDAASSGSRNGPNSRSDTDAQLSEFGMPAEQPAARSRSGIQGSSQQMDIPDFGAFNPIGMAQAGQQQPQRRVDNGFGQDFGNLANMGQDLGQARSSGGNQSPGNEFDFAGQPSSNQGDQTTAMSGNGGAPGSLQSLLGAGFPGLGGNGGSVNSGGLDDFARGGNNPQQRASDDGSLDMADLGDKSDQFSGADLGGFEQPSPKNDQDFNLAAAAAKQQPISVPYPDGSPQAVGTLWALSQPQSLTQTRYNALPDKGTYQDYPAYQSGGNDFGAVAQVVDSTPKARPPGPGRYSTPSSAALAPEHRPPRGQQIDYGQTP